MLQVYDVTHRGICAKRHSIHSLLDCTASPVLYTIINRTLSGFLDGGSSSCRESSRVVLYCCSVFEYPRTMASSSTTCKVCMKLVLDTEEGIACESKCNRWFHRACVSISKADYAQFSKDLNKKWHCNRVDCVPSSEDPIIVLTSSLNKLMDKIDSWSDQIGKITEVSTGIGEIKSDIGLIKDQISKLEPRVSANEMKIDNLKSIVESTIKNGKSSDPESIIKEMNDRSQRAKNAIMENTWNPRIQQQ